jgi:hypothetical protein
MWRDILPPALHEGLMGLKQGDNIVLKFAGGEVIQNFEESNLFELKRSQFKPRQPGKGLITPQIGRFYPKGFLKGMAGIFKDNVSPFRCVGLNNGHLSVDFNHPLAGKDLKLSTIVGKVEPKRDERGGTSVDWIERLVQGPGMQTRWRNRASDYLTDDAFKRVDIEPDSVFYRKPRFTQHLDEMALSVVQSTYARFLGEGMVVLDLMSSWQSHVPEELSLKGMVGLGLNRAELDRNPQLTESLVHDLNADFGLPFDSDSFDAVLCTVSVEYLVEPLNVFQEVGRTLKPGGYLIVTFSNRWFPPKVIQGWTDLHEFERLGMVLEYFIRTNVFNDLHTYSIRGLPRSHDDKYFPELLFSDPIYAIWGRKRIANQ